MLIKKDTLIYYSEIGHNNMIYPNKDKFFLLQEELICEQISLFNLGIDNCNVINISYLFEQQLQKLQILLLIKIPLNIFFIGEYSKCS